MASPLLGILQPCSLPCSIPRLPALSGLSLGSLGLIPVPSQQSSVLDLPFVDLTQGKGPLAGCLMTLCPFGKGMEVQMGQGRAASACGFL